MIQWVRNRFRNRRTDAKTYWRKRFADDPDGWVAGGDRRWTDEVNYNSALEIMAALTDVLERHAAPFAGKTLLDAGIISRERRGKWSYYSIEDDRLAELGVGIDRFARTVARTA